MRKLCPGQDTRFWKPDDVFEVRCAGCSSAVEFFKDDVSRTCPSCGRRIRNPKFNPGCARWCSHARECLGFDPGAGEPAQEETLAGRLMEALERFPGGNSGRAGKVLEFARGLLEKEKADPKIVTAAVLLRDMAAGAGGNGKEAKEGIAAAARAMEEAGMHWSEILEVKKIISAAANGEAGSLESRIVSEALKLAEDDDLR